MEGAAELATLPKESYGRWVPIVKEIGFAADLVAALKEAH